MWVSVRRKGSVYLRDLSLQTAEEVRACLRLVHVVYLEKVSLVGGRNI